MVVYFYFQIPFGRIISACETTIYVELVLLTTKTLSALPPGPLYMTSSHCYHSLIEH